MDPIMGDIEHLFKQVSYFLTFYITLLFAGVRWV